MSTNLVQNDMKQSTSPTSTAISTDSLTSTDTNSSICSCVSTISIMQDKYNEVDSNNNALSIENERLWAIVNKLEQENQKLTLESDEHIIESDFSNTVKKAITKIDYNISKEDAAVFTEKKYDSVQFKINGKELLFSVIK